MGCSSLWVLFFSWVFYPKSSSIFSIPLPKCFSVLVCEFVVVIMNMFVFIVSSYHCFILFAYESGPFHQLVHHLQNSDIYLTHHCITHKIVSSSSAICTICKECSTVMQYHGIIQFRWLCSYPLHNYIRYVYLESLLSKIVCIFGCESKIQLYICFIVALVYTLVIQCVQCLAWLPLLLQPMSL